MRQARWLSMATSMVCSGAAGAVVAVPAADVGDVTEGVDEGLSVAPVESMEAPAERTRLVSIPLV